MSSLPAPAIRWLQRPRRTIRHQLAKAVSIESLHGTGESYFVGEDERSSAFESTLSSLMFYLTSQMTFMTGAGGLDGS